MVKLICLLKKKPGSTSQQFREYYETRHAPLALRLLPFFSSYTRNYVVFDEAHQSEHLADPLQAPGFDAVTEIGFNTRADYEAMQRALADPIIGGQVADDEAAFMDRKAMMVFFVETHVTPPEQLASRRRARL